MKPVCRPLISASSSPHWTITRRERSLPSACPKIAATTTEQNEQNDDQDDQLSIVHHFCPSLVKTKSDAAVLRCRLAHCPRKTKVALTSCPSTLCRCQSSSSCLREWSRSCR